MYSPVRDEYRREGQHELSDVGKRPVDGSGQSLPRFRASQNDGGRILVAGCGHLVDRHVIGVGGREDQGQSVERDDDECGRTGLHAGAVRVHDGRVTVQSDQHQG